MFLKHTPFKLILYLFINQIYKKYSVHVCLVLKKCVPLLLYEVGPEIWKMYCFFSAETTIHNSQYNMCSTKLRAKDYPHAGHLGLLVVIESSIASRKHATASIH